MRQWRSRPVQERRRICLTSTWAIETTTEVHVRSRTSFYFVFTEDRVGPKRKRMKRRCADWPDIACSPSLGFRQDVSKMWTVKNAGVLPLQPMVEPGNRLHVKTLPRPGESMLSHHCDLHTPAVRQAFVRSECVRQMEGHVLPVAP